MASHHGGCPVIRGQKWAANLWIWNGIRLGFTGSPVRNGISTAGTVEDAGKGWGSTGKKAGNTVNFDNTGNTGSPKHREVKVDFSTNSEKENKYFLYWRDQNFGTSTYHCIVSILNYYKHVVLPSHS